MEDLLNSSKDFDSTTDNKNKKTPIIIFAKLNKYYLIPFLCLICCMLTNYLYSWLKKTNIVKKNELFISIYFEFANMITGLLYFVTYFHQKIKRGKESIYYKETLPLYIKCNKNNQNNKLKEWFLIILLGILSAFFEIVLLF